MRSPPQRRRSFPGRLYTVFYRPAAPHTAQAISPGHLCSAPGQLDLGGDDDSDLLSQLAADKESVRKAGVKPTAPLSWVEDEYLQKQLALMKH
jgi:hypothetical protein